MNCTALKELLEEFVKKNCEESEYPKELDELLTDTAKTGVVRFSWNLLKPLLKFRLESVFKSESLTRQADKKTEDEELSKHLLQRLDLFDNPPFTIQRVCELVMDPRQHYKRRDKYMRAMEKNLMVVGTQEPDLTWMKSPRLTQLLEEKTGQLSNHMSVEHPTQSHLAGSPEGGSRVDVASPADRGSDQDAATRDQGEPVTDQEEVMGRVLQEADSTTLDHVCQPAESEESLAAVEHACPPEVQQEVEGAMDYKGGSQSGMDRAVRDEFEHSGGAGGDKVAVGAFEETTKGMAADETGQYISNKSSVVIAEDRSNPAGVLEGGSAVGATAEGVTEEVNDDGVLKNGEGSRGIRQLEENSQMTGTDSSGALVLDMAGTAGNGGDSGAVVGTWGSGEGFGGTQNGSESERQIPEGAAYDSSLSAKTEDNRGADEATGEVKITGVGVTFGGGGSNGTNGRDSDDFNGCELGEELAPSCVVDDDKVCMETGEASVYGAPEERSRSYLEKVYEGSSAEQCMVGRPAAGVGGAALLGVEEVSELSVIDEGDWVVVEVGGAGAAAVADKAAAATGFEGSVDSQEEALGRPAKRPRPEDDEDKEEDDKVMGGEEPVTKQSRVEESDGKEVVDVFEGVAKGDSPQQDESRVEQEQDAERTYSMEPTDSSYKEEATGQVEAVEGNQDQAESS